MRVTFLGVGEACDERYPNTSLLVRVRSAGAEKTILLDCGFSVPHRFFRHVEDPDVLDAVWISHFHGDHFFGLPLLLLRFWEMKRRRPLTVVAPAEESSKIKEAMELAYPGFLKRIQYPLHIKEMRAGEDQEIHGVLWRAAPTEHSRPNLGLRLDAGSASLFYSGDGRPTKDTEALARGAHLAVHEAFHVEDGAVPGHGTVANTVRWAEAAGVRRLVLVHIQRDVRRGQWDRIQEALSAVTAFPVQVAETDEVLTVGDED